MARIPEHLTRMWRFSRLECERRGKVRRIYRLPWHPHLRLHFYTDQVSVYDIVLNGWVEYKGETLAAENIWWRTTGPLKDTPGDLVAYGSAIDEYLPPELHGNPVLHRRAIVVLDVPKDKRIPFELIVRSHLDGSALDAYRNEKLICGHDLPRGLRKGSLLPHGPIVTPTTKAEKGPDLPVDHAVLDRLYGVGLAFRAVCQYERAAAYMAERGLVLLDAKSEAAFHPVSGEFIWIDALFDADGMRVVRKDNWEAAMRGEADLRYLCKEVVRQWAVNLGIKSKNPLNASDVAYVQERLPLPEGIANVTTGAYLELFQILTGQPLRVFQRDVMKIAI